MKDDTFLPSPYHHHPKKPPPSKPKCVKFTDFK